MENKVYIVCKEETGADHKIYDTDILGIYTSKDKAELNRNLFMINIDANNLQIIEKDLNKDNPIKDMYAHFEIKFKLGHDNKLYSYYKLLYTDSEPVINVDIEPNSVKYSFTDNNCVLQYIVRLSNFDRNLPFDDLKKKAKELLIEKTNRPIKELFDMIDNTVISIHPILDDNHNLILLRPSLFITDTYKFTNEAKEAYIYIIESFQNRFVLGFNRFLEEKMNLKFTQEEAKAITNIIQEKMNIKFPDFKINSKVFPKTILKRYIAEDSYDFFKFD